MNKALAVALSNQKIFRTADLACLWKENNSNTLYTTIKRYVQKGILHRIQKGLYSLVDPSKLDPIELSSKIVPGYSYLSMQSVLFQEGYISQRPLAYTFVGEKSFRLGSKIVCSKLQDKYLFNPLGTEIFNSVRVASPVRAIVDMLYYNSKAYFDSKVDWKAVNAMQKELMMPVTKR